MTYKIFYNTDKFIGKSDEQLKALIRVDENARIELAKRRHGLSGDVYLLLPDNYLEDAISHKSAVPDSIATTIDEMAQERIRQIEREFSAD